MRTKDEINDIITRSQTRIKKILYSDDTKIPNEDKRDILW